MICPTPPAQQKTPELIQLVEAGTIVSTRAPGRTALRSGQDITVGLQAPQ
jgi:hypothetical protein